MLRARSSGVNCPLIAPPLLNYTFQSGRLRLQHALCELCAVWEAAYSQVPCSSDFSSGDKDFYLKKSTCLVLTAVVN